MASSERTFEIVKELPALARVTATGSEKISHYDDWTEYDQDCVVLGYNGPSHTADCISAQFSGNREAARILDVACGTGNVAKEMKKRGFTNFVGIDGSKNMLQGAQKTGLYKDLKQCVLAEQLLPVERGSFDIVVMCGGLGVNLVAVNVVRELCNACAPGGNVFMTSSNGPENREYKAALEHELKKMEEEVLWCRVAVIVMENWIKSMSAEGDYLSASVYVYKKV